MVPVCHPCLAKLYITVLPSPCFPCAVFDSLILFHVSASQLLSLALKKKGTNLMKLLVFVDVARKRPCFFRYKGRQCKTGRGEKKICSLHHQEGEVWILHFQVLIHWILEVGGSPTMKYHIYDLHGRKHETFQLCPCMLIFFNRYIVPTENDDERIISCSLCRAISQPLCQKKV